MRRLLRAVVLFLLISASFFLPVGCGEAHKTTDLDDGVDPKNIGEGIEVERLTIEINGRKADVTWLDNDSVRALAALAKDELTVTLSSYGGFEQVGSLGKALPRSDVRTTTAPGDIVLYSGDQIVLFYGSNTWSYTRLGHLDLRESELRDLLSGETVVLTLKIE